MLLLAISLIYPLSNAPAIAQDDVPIDVATEVAPAAEPVPVAEGSLEIRLTDSNGSGISGLLAVTDAVGAYHEMWTEGGIAWFPALAAGTAIVSQLTVATDYAFDTASPGSIDIPAGGHAVLPITNLFLDADGDGVGDSVDICAAGSDTVDTDADATPDACDSTPSDDLIGTSEPDSANIPNQSSDDETPVDDETADVSAVSAEVSEEEVVVSSSQVSCDQAASVAPWVTTDVEDYPPGALVTLTSGGWVPGQVIEVLVDDDGIADAVEGSWIHEGVAIADADGNFEYQFTIAPWFVANYTVVATGECSEARTTFTDSVTGGNCVQVSGSDIVTVGNYVMFRCPSTSSPFKLKVDSISAGWQWASIYSSVTNLPPPSYSSLTWSNIPDELGASGGNSQVYVFLSPITTQPGAVGTVNVTITPNSSSVAPYSSSLTGRQSATAPTFQMVCTPASFTVSVIASQAVSCSLSASNLTGSASVTIPAITAPTGWTISAPSPASGSVTNAAPFTFSFTSTPSCSASTTAQSVTVTSNLIVQSVSTTGPTAALSIARTSGSAASVVITASSLSWSRAYAFTSYPTNSGTMTYNVQDAGCGGWNVTLVATNFVYTGPNSGSPIAASNLTLTGSTLPSGTGITRPATSGPLNSAINILRATAPNGNGTFSQTLDLNLNVPAGVIVGQYQSVVTIAVAAGP